MTSASTVAHFLRDGLGGFQYLGKKGLPAPCVHRGSNEADSDRRNSRPCEIEYGCRDARDTFDGLSVLDDVALLRIFASFSLNS
jgi:hypothetical protein